MIDQALALRRLLYANGYQPVEVKTGTKAPARVAWQTKVGVSPARPDALSTGIACRGLCPLDIDVDDADAVARIIIVVNAVAGHNALIRTRADSAHCMLLFRAPDGMEPKKRVIQLGTLGKIEILGNGQQFVAYGVHPEGAEFEWLDAGPDVVKRDDAPVLTPEHEAEIKRRIYEEFGIEPEQPPASVSSSRPVAPVIAAPRLAGDRERAYFESALADEIAKVAGAGEGQRNHTLNTAAFSLAQMVASGWGGQAEVWDALTEAALACGLRQPEIRKTIASGFAGGAKKPRELQDREGYGDLPPEVEGIDLSRLRPKLATVGGQVVDASAAPYDGDDDLDDEEFEPEIDRSLANVDGVLGEIVDWITACDPEGNRLLALAAALPLMSTLLGRRMATPTGGGGGLELYVVSLLPSSGGKSVAMDGITRILEVAGLDNQHLAPPEFRSGSAFGDILCRMPLSISIIDEIADYLGPMLSERRQSHQQELEKYLKEQWGKGFKSFKTAHSRTAGSTKVFAPCYSIYGVTTPESLFRVIKSQHLTSGFINRFTVINAVGQGSPHRPTELTRHPPDRLIENVRSMYRMGQKGSGNLGFGDKNQATDPEPVLVPWETQHAEDCFLAFEAECKELRDSLGDLGKVYGRTAFMAVKMATIRACGRISPVTLDDIQWGIAIAKQSADLFRAELAGKMLDPLSAGEMLLKIEHQFTKPTEKAKALMARYGAMTLPRRFLFENLKRHISRHPGEFENALKAMQYGGQIAMGKAPQSGAKEGVEIVQYLARRSRKAAA